MGKDGSSCSLLPAVVLSTMKVSTINSANAFDLTSSFSCSLIVTLLASVCNLSPCVPIHSIRGYLQIAPFSFCIRWAWMLAIQLSIRSSVLTLLTSPRIFVPLICLTERQCFRKSCEASKSRRNIVRDVRKAGRISRKTGCPPQSQICKKGCGSNLMISASEKRSARFIASESTSLTVVCSISGTLASTRDIVGVKSGSENRATALIVSGNKLKL